MPRRYAPSVRASRPAAIGGHDRQRDFADDERLAGAAADRQRASMLMPSTGPGSSDKSSTMPARD